MFIIWKNKGIMIFLYIIVSFIGTALLLRFLKGSFGGFLERMDLYFVMGIAFLFAAIWTYLTKDDHYRDKDGNKKKLDIENELFFINMGIWAYILAGLGIVFLLNEIFRR